MWSQETLLKQNDIDVKQLKINKNAWKEMDQEDSFKSCASTSRSLWLLITIISTLSAYFSHD